MADSSTFKERLEHMEPTRDERLVLLQAEKELQINKSQVLESKLLNIRSIEQRCLKPDHEIASQNFVVSSLSSEIDRLDSQYLTDMKQFRVSKSEVEEIAELEKGKEIYFDAKNFSIAVLLISWFNTRGDRLCWLLITYCHGFDKL